MILRKYATGTAAGTHVYMPLPKAGSNDYSVSADWTPAAGDVKVSKDGGAQANITTLPTFSNGQWIFQFSAAELTAKTILVQIVDTAPKAVDDNAFVIETYGNASAMLVTDFSNAASMGMTNLDATVSSRAAATGVNVTQWGGTNIPAPDTAGYPKVTLKGGNGAGEISLTAGIIDTVNNVTGNVSGSVAEVLGNVGGNVQGKVLGDSLQAFAGNGVQIDTSAIPTANQNADALLDRAAGVETGLTVRQWLRLGGAVLFGKTSNSQKTFRDFADTKDRIVSTLDTDGDRTTVTHDAT